MTLSLIFIGERVFNNSDIFVSSPVDQINFGMTNASFIKLNFRDACLEVVSDFCILSRAKRSGFRLSI